MTLHPQVQAILDMLAENPPPPPGTLSPDEMRAFYAAMSDVTDPKDVPIGKTENLTAPGPAGDIPVRIYTPVAAATVTPALVFFHGGGWVIGTLETHDALCRLLANDSGCKVVSVDYRLAPEHPFPAAADDAFAATKWVYENAADMGIDASCIAVGGDSAGGNLAAVVCHMAQSTSVKIGFQMLFYPVTEALADTPSMTAFATGYLLERDAMEWFVAQYVPDGTNPKDPKVSPLLADSFKGQPPAYVVTAGYDPLRDEGRAYADKLDEAGVEVAYINYDDLIHGFYTMAGVVEPARAAIKDAAMALKTAFD